MIAILAREGEEPVFECSQFVQDYDLPTGYIRCCEHGELMAPLIVMVATWILVRAVGFAGLWQPANSSAGALRFAFVAMFLFTAASHFHPRTRNDLIRMVPASLPLPSLLVTLTGAFEFIGAIGLLVPSTASAAAYALIGLLMVMFPANVHAARRGLVIAGRRATPLGWRLPLQVFWIVALWWVARTTGISTVFFATILRRC